MEKFFEESADASPFLKFEEGKTKVRIISDSFTLGWEGWYQNKPVRVSPNETLKPAEKKLLDKQKSQKDGSEYPKYKQFAACLVWNYKLNAVQIWQFSQQSVTKQIMALKSNPDWGDLGSFDITVERKGLGLDTEYTITPSPKKPVSKEVENAKSETTLNPASLLTDAGNLARLQEIREKAGTAKSVEDIVAEDEISPGDIPF